MLGGFLRVEVLVSASERPGDSGVDSEGGQHQSSGREEHRVLRCCFVIYMIYIVCSRKIEYSSESARDTGVSAENAVLKTACEVI